VTGTSSASNWRPFWRCIFFTQKSDFARKWRKNTIVLKKIEHAKSPSTYKSIHTLSHSFVSSAKHMQLYLATREGQRDLKPATTHHKICAWCVGMVRYRKRTGFIQLNKITYNASTPNFLLKIPHTQINLNKHDNNSIQQVPKSTWWFGIVNVHCGS